MPRDIGRLSTGTGAAATGVGAVLIVALFAMLCLLPKNTH
ncbi:Hypothetical protein RAK1035_1857 [Roseovarius sp. AK1035]|nr:Hypothetical protein RAK1035_1857 [Roseovarius sp. AK1035]